MPLPSVRCALAPVLVAAVTALLAAAPPASAGLCKTPLADGLGFAWDLANDGSVLGGSHDAYDGFGTFKVGGLSYTSPDVNGCGLEESGQEVTYPVASLGGLQVSRKVYVPSSGLAFARFLDVVTNPGGSTVATTISWEGNLGSDGGTQILSTSSGDATVTSADIWGASADATSDPTADPPVVHVWDGPGSPADTADEIYGTTNSAWATGDDVVRVRYTNVSIPAGGTVAYMHVELQRSTITNVLSGAQSVAAAPVSLFEGLSSTELASIRNWVTSDIDGDGVTNGGDNCATVSNASQADLDGDGTGDACDDDIDGDGLSNAAEATIGTNPNSADTDGDGKRDNVDVCPRTAGQGTDGCPRYDTPPSAPADTTAPTLRLISIRRSLKLKTFRRGFSAAASCNEACSLKFELLGSTKRAKLSKNYNVTLAKQSLGMGGTGTRAVRLRPSRRLLRGARKFRVQIRVTATDQAGNRTVKTKTTRVKKRRRRSRKRRRRASKRSSSAHSRAVALRAPKS